jgi:Flp pilus assembly pilin Flp
MAHKPERSVTPKGVEELCHDESAQAMAEYAIVVVFMILALAAIFAAFPGVIRDYFGAVARIICFPVP